MTKFEEVKHAKALPKETIVETMWQAREYMSTTQNPQWSMPEDHELLVDTTRNVATGIKRVWFDVLSNEFFAKQKKSK